MAYIASPVRDLFFVIFEISTVDATKPALIVRKGAVQPRNSELRFSRLSDPGGTDLAAVRPRLGAGASRKFLVRSPRQVRNRAEPAVHTERLTGMSMTGTVKFFNTEKGYGFIKPDDGGKDIFVHISAVQRSGLASLAEGQKLSFELEPDKRGKGPKAVNLAVRG